MLSWLCQHTFSWDRGLPGLTDWGSSPLHLGQIRSSPFLGTHEQILLSKAFTIPWHQPPLIAPKAKARLSMLANINECTGPQFQTHPSQNSKALAPNVFLKFAVSFLGGQTWPEVTGDWCSPYLCYLVYLRSTPEVLIRLLLRCCPKTHWKNYIVRLSCFSKT